MSVFRGVWNVTPLTYII